MSQDKRSVARKSALLLLWLVTACGGGANFTLIVEFPDKEVRSRVWWVEIWALRAPPTGSCSDLIAGRTRPSALEQLAHLDMDFPPAGRTELKGVEAGPAWFFAQASGGGAVLLRGCSEVQVDTGKSHEVVIRLVCVCNPLAEHCGPQEEKPSDGQDNDCDGKTDEVCERDEDCDDKLACTHDSCLIERGACLNQKDDALCPDDGVFCNGPEICDPRAGCTGSGDPCAAAGLICDEESESCRSCTEDSECADAYGCTLDGCDAGSGLCVHQPQDSLCPDDGVFCNGAEFCDERSGCQHRGDPCRGQGSCNEQSRSCVVCPTCTTTWFFTPTGGGASLVFSGYRAKLFVAPAGPAGKTASGNFIVRLGPASVAAFR